MPTLGPYQLTERLGRGGMGEVWSAFRADTREPVAVKVMTAITTRHGPYLRAFRQEVRSVAALRHPAIVRVYDQGEVRPEESVKGELATGSPYLVMELAELGTLERLEGRIQWDALQAVLLQLLCDTALLSRLRVTMHVELYVLLMGTVCQVMLSCML